MPDPAAPGGAVPHQAERKLVTVLLAEVDEAVTTWSDPDPEDVEQSLTAHVARVQAEVERFGGAVEQRVGSRALGVFGLPRTHDDDPERAVQAALAIRRALAATQGTRVRVTVATGRALVRLGARGAAGAAGQRVLGDPITTCARLLEVAPPDAGLVTEATVRASERAIAYGPAGMVTLHSGEPAAVWSPLDPDGAAAPGPPRRRSPPLVARGAELGALLDELTAVLASRRPRLVTVLGQAGIGKSRLLAELAAALEADPRPVAWRQGRSPPYGAMAFLPLAEVVKAEAAIIESDTAEQAERKLRRTVERVLGRDGREATAWVAGQLLRLVGATAGTGGAGQLDDDHSEEMLVVWRRFLHALAAERPLVLAVEDAQWADPALLDFLESLADPRAVPAGGAPLLVIVTARPELGERRPRWARRRRAHSTTVQLEPLSSTTTACRRPSRPSCSRGSAATRCSPRSTCACCGTGAWTWPRRPAPPCHCPRRCTGSSAPASTPCPRPRRRSCRTRPCSARPAGWARWPRSAAASPPCSRPACGGSRPGSCSSSTGAPTPRAWPGTPSGTWCCETWPTGRSSGRSGPPSTSAPPPGWSGSAPAGRGSAPTCSLTTTARRSSCHAPPASRSRASRSAPGPRCARPATAPRRWGCTPARPAPTPRRWSCARSASRGAPPCCCGSGGHAAAARARARPRSWPPATCSSPAASRSPRPRPSCCSASSPSSKAAVAKGRMAHLAMANRHAEAREAAAEVLVMARELGLRDLEADALGTIGLARVDAGDAGGLGELEAAIATFERQGTPAVSWHLNLAYALAALGDLGRCFATWAAAARLAERFGSMRSLRSIQLQRVAEHYWTGRWDEAVAVVDALVASPGGEGHYLEWECRVWRGRIRLARGDLDGALDDSAAALELARRTNDPMALNPACAFRACALLAAGREGAARAMTGELLAGLGGSLLGAEISADLGTALAALGHPLALLDGCGVPPSPWLGAARALVVGEPWRAAEIYARIGARPEEAGARLAAARLALAAGRPADADADLGTAAAFYREVGAHARA